MASERQHLGGCKASLMDHTHNSYMHRAHAHKKHESIFLII